MTSVGFAQQNDRASVGSLSANDRATEIPVTRLGVTFVIPLEDPEALNFLHRAVETAAGRFDFKLTAFADCASPPPVKPAEDWSKLVTPKLLIESGRITEILRRERDLIVLDSCSEKTRVDVNLLGEMIRRDHLAMTGTTPPLRSPVPKPADPEPSEYHGPIPPSQAQLPTEPTSRVEAAHQIIEAAQESVKSHRIAPPPPAPLPAPAFTSRPGTLGERLIAYLRDLKSKGQPMPGNRDIADFLGVSAKQFPVLLTGLRAKEAVDYEWRPAPTLEDQTLQRRFVTKA